jgi:hypothetical protein
MAFSATIRTQAYLGPGLRKLYGDWTGSAGDAAGTMTIYGNIPKGGIIFQKFDALDATNQILPRVECSYSAGITTITVENQDNVTQGSFEILCMGM